MSRLYYKNLDAQIDDYIYRIENEGFVSRCVITFPDPIGGTLKVIPDVERLKKLKRQLKLASVFSGRPRRTRLPESRCHFRPSKASIVNEFTRDGEMENARQYIALLKK